MIHQVNDTLWRVEKELCTNSDLQYPVIFIIAPPRSGTTMLYQLLVYYYKMFYPTNLMARFYKSSGVFMETISGLDLFERVDTISFESKLGNTKGLFEPHEWGWFWDEFLHKKPEFLMGELTLMQKFYPLPMLFKNIYFNYEIEKLVEIINNKAVFIVLNRDLHDIALSIKNAILTSNDVIGSKYHHCFFRQFDDVSELATLQTLYDCAKIDKDTAKIGNIIKVDYSDICSNPIAKLDAIGHEICKITGCELDKRVVDYNKIKINTKPKSQDAEIMSCIELYKNCNLEELEGILFRKEHIKGNT